MPFRDQKATTELTDIVDMCGSLARRVYHALRPAILSMAYPCGNVPKNSAICDQPGVSRAPVSGAITRLSAEGRVARTRSLQRRQARMRFVPKEGRLAEVLQDQPAVLPASAARDPVLNRTALRYHLGQMMSRITSLEQSRPTLFRSH